MLFQNYLDLKYSDGSENFWNKIFSARYPDVLRGGKAKPNYVHV